MEEGKELSIDHQDSGELEQQPGAAVSVEAKARPIDEKKVQGKMHHVIKLVSQSVKRAKTFETQRIVKRLKSSKAKAKEEEEEGGPDLEKELEVTKAVEAQAVALQALWTKLGKARLLPRGAASDSFPLLSILGPTHPLIEEASRRRGADGSGPSTTSVNDLVRSRLVSSKIVSDEVSRGVSEIERLLGLGSQKKVTQKAKDRTSTAPATREIGPTRASKKLPVEAELDEDGKSTVFAGVKKEAEKEEAGERKRKRLPSPTPSRHSSEDSHLSGQDEDLEDEDGSDPFSGSEDEEEEGTTFLPSLATGFVGGRGLNLGRGSDDEWSDGDAELESIDSDAEDRGLDGKVRAGARKNRMGQRARKALWEKKYGRNANHLKLREREPRVPRMAGAAMGGRGAAKMHPDRLRRNIADTGHSFDRAGGRPPPEKRAEREEKRAKTQEMHPSWVAKQKQKEMVEAAARAAAGGPTSKKIVFD